VVAIDGPAGSGKSTIARAVAAELGLPHVDTGALYRAAALACLRAEVDLDDAEACTTGSSERPDRARRRPHLLDGEDVEDEIRGDAVTAAVSTVSAHPGVRDALLPAQRRAVEPDGRGDGGSRHRFGRAARTRT
jgi:cytidylate kinase